MSADIKSAIRCPTVANALNNCLTQRGYPEECRFTRVGGGATVRTPSPAAEVAVRTMMGSHRSRESSPTFESTSPVYPAARSRTP
jgi:hypothetical protein